MTNTALPPSSAALPSDAAPPAAATAATAATAILHRDPVHPPPVAVRGEGSYLWDADGRRYLDACGGAAVSCLGHAHPAVIAAMTEQLQRLEYAHTSFFTTEAAERLAAHLLARAPASFGRAYFVSGGSEAVETAMKLARQYWVERGEPRRDLFIARRQSYHGNTLAALSIGGNAGRRAPYQPLLLASRHVSPCFAFRHRGAGESDDAYGRRLADELSATIDEAGPERVIAFVAETVVGATAGAVTAVPGYFARIREVCDRYGILLILDEVMCGMSRTGTTFAFEQEGVVPDLVTMAKGLGGGFAPIGAVLAGRNVVDAILHGSGAFQHGHTYIGHPLACAAGLAVQRVIVEQDLTRRVADAGRRLGARLRDAFGEHPHVADVRGRGLLWALELVADRSDDRPFDPALRVHARIRQAAQRHGLLCYPGGGTIDGVRGDHVLLAPSYLADDDEFALIVEGLRRAIDDVAAALPPGA
ncbi:MAG: aspartate aminotransferase family protein [Burkholderiaceae bacterium]